MSVSGEENWACWRKRAYSASAGGDQTGVALMGGDVPLAGGVGDPDPPPQAASAAATAEAAARDPALDGATEASESAGVTRSFDTVASPKTPTCADTLGLTQPKFKRDVAPEFRTVWSWTKLDLRFPTFPCD